MSKVRTGLAALFMIVALTISLPLAAFAGELEARISNDSITTNGAELLGVSDLLPGDSYQTTLSIVNDSERDQKVSFFLDYSNLPEVKEFAKIATLDIAHEGQVVFSGHLSEVASDMQGIHVLNLKPGESDELSFWIELPFEADEIHMDQFATFDWSIHAEAQNATGSSNNPENPTPSVTTPGSNHSIFGPGGFFAKTGEDLSLLVIIAGACFVLSFALIAFAGRKSRNEEESEDE